MIRRLSLVRRLDSLTQEEFLTHWMGPHADIVKQLPGVRRIRFNAVNEWTPGERAWDGVGEVWFDSVEAARAAFAAQPFQAALVEDRAKFLSSAELAFLEERKVWTPT